jgi:hypothetical protein
MTTRAIQIESLADPLIDPITGSLCSGYTAYFYAAGTSTPKNVWTEKEKTNPFTSYVLDSGGKALLYGDGIYKIVVKNLDATIILTLDNQKIQANTFSVVQKVGTYTATPDDDVILADGTFTVNIADIATFEHPLLIKNIGSGTITIDPSGSQTIDGSATKTLPVSGQSLEIVPDTTSNIWRSFGASIMYGDTNTIIWMYLNTAPTGWTVLATGADMVLAVAGGSAAYNVNGGNPDSVATWTISGLTKDAHTHTITHTHSIADHVHQIYEFETPGGAVVANIYNYLGAAIDLTYAVVTEVGLAVTAGGEAQLNQSAFTKLGGTSVTSAASDGNTGAQSANGVTSSGAWRPKASVGKLFQLSS